MKSLKYIRFLSLALCLFVFGCGNKNSSDDTPPVFSDAGLHIESPKEDPLQKETAADTTNETTDTDTVADTEPPYILNDTPDTAPVFPVTDPVPETEADTDAASETAPPVSTDSELEYTPDTDVSAEEETEVEEIIVTDTSSEKEKVLPDIIDLSGILSVDFPSVGQFVSHQSEKIKLIVNYECTMLPTGVVQIDLEAGLESYDINCGARADDGKVTVDGQTQAFSTDALVHEDRTKKFFPFTVYTYQSTSGQTSCEIDVSWLYNGTYAGEKIDTLIASAVFKWD